jgi:N-acetyl-anhydromuramyl-L-alanine amidase AmpD
MYSSYRSEEAFLLSARQVSAHFLIGKEGQITQFLPLALAAWHAGRVISADYDNQSTIGIEMHYTPKEPISTVQLHTLERLICCLRDVTAVHTIVTHRAIAFPKGRKHDPSNMTDADVAALRSRCLHLQRYTVRGGSHLFCEPACQTIAKHITNTEYHEGIARTTISFYGKAVENAIWNSTGVGFHRFEDSVR